MGIGTLMTLQGTLFAFVIIGIILRKTGMVPADVESTLTDMVIYVFLPCNLALSFRIEVDMQLLKGLVIIFAIACAIQAVAWCLSRVLYRKYPVARQRVLQYGTVCSNAGFMGLPIVSSVFGTTGLMYASIAIIPQRIVMWSAGVSLFTEAPDTKTLIKKVATHPCIIAVYVGLVLMFFDPPLPAFVEKTVTSLSACSTPLSMILVGLIVADVSDIKSVFSWDVVRFTIIRLGVIPGLAYLICRITGTPQLLMGVTVLLAAMPAGTMTSILSAKYHGDAEFACKCVVLSTVMTLVTLPLWCMVL